MRIDWEEAKRVRALMDQAEEDWKQANVAKKTTEEARRAAAVACELAYKHYVAVENAYCRAVGMKYDAVFYAEWLKEQTEEVKA